MPQLVSFTDEYRGKNVEFDVRETNKNIFDVKVKRKGADNLTFKVDYVNKKIYFKKEEFCKFNYEVDNKKSKKNDGKSTGFVLSN